MSVFPETSRTLVLKLAVEVTGERESAWVRFFDLYQPAIRKFAEWHARDQDPDDVVQEVFLKLAKVLRERRFIPEKGRFRSFLATVIRNEIISMYRKDLARGEGRRVSLDQLEDERANSEGGTGFHRYDPALVLQPEQEREIDLHWAHACHAAAVEHVLTKMAISARNKEIYREHVLKGRSAAEVARDYGVEKNLVGQIKFRLSQAIEKIEQEFCNGR